MYIAQRATTFPQVIFEAQDVEYARELFTELVLQRALSESTHPSTAELAQTAIRLANRFRAALDRDDSTPAIAPSSEMEATRSGTGSTFKDIAQIWAAREAKHLSGYTPHRITARFARYLYPIFGDKPIEMIQPSDVLAALRTPEAKQHRHVCYQLLTDLRKFFNYSIARELIQQDPTLGINRASFRGKRRARVPELDDAELGRLIVAIRDYKGRSTLHTRFLFQLMPMVFLRTNELRLLEWTDIDLDNSTAAIPAERMKNRYPHVVPLPRQAVRLLRAMQKRSGKGRYVFSRRAQQDKPLNHGAVNRSLQAIGWQHKMSAHGFRTMAGTWMNEEGWRYEAIERQLSHTLNHIFRHGYNQAEHLAERRKMMQAWADHLDAVEHKARMASRPLNIDR